MEGPFEIERRFLIRFPDLAFLRKNAEASEITQIYLRSTENGGRARIRRRRTNGTVVYTHTVKERVNDLRRVERERVIDAEEFEALCAQADPQRRTLDKTRYCFPFREHIFEIDVYPFWQDRALMEVELTSEEEAVCLPPQLQVIREVTSDRRYTNAALAKSLPEEAL